VTRAYNQTTNDIPSTINNRIKDCQAQTMEVVKDMQAASQAFRSPLRSPYPVYLSVQKLATGAVYLRWRKSGIKGKQPYLQLEGSQGQRLLTALPPPLRQHYFNFHQQLLSLNLQHALLLAEQRRLELTLQHWQAFVQLKAQFP